MRCPICETGVLTPLGQVGRKVWARCRDCGIDVDVTETLDDMEDILNA